MPRKAKKRMGRPPGSKNKTTKMGRPPKKVTISMDATTGKPIVELECMLWDTLKDAQAGKVACNDLRRVLTQTSELLTVLEAQV